MSRKNVRCSNIQCANEFWRYEEPYVDVVSFAHLLLFFNLAKLYDFHLRDKSKELFLCYFPSPKLKVRCFVMPVYR